MLLLLGASALFMVSCARDGFDDNERWESSVTNTQLFSPLADDITIMPDATGANQIISWPVVLGASKYECRLVDTTNPDNPKTIYEGLVDGCSIKAPREDDTFYEFQIRTLANTSKGNIDAEETTSLVFNTTIPTYKTIPSGTDLTTFFASETIPDSEIDPVTKQLIPVAYNLEPGGNYTVSDVVKFGNKIVLIRCQSSSNLPVITVEETGKFEIMSGFTLKNLEINTSSITNKGYTLISLSKEPDESLKIPSGQYAITSAVSLVNCDIRDLPGTLINDNSISYVLDNFTISKSIIRFNNISNTDGGRCIYFNKSMPVNFTILNSTLYNAGDATDWYFAQIHGNEPAKLTGYTKGVFTFVNNTFYNLAKAKQFINTNTFKGKASVGFEWRNNIFVDCGNKAIWDKITNGNNPIVASNNTYWFNGANAGEKYDTNVLGTDPAFVDPVNGNFTPTGAEQLEKRTGDPRWLPAEN